MSSAPHAAPSPLDGVTTRREFITPEIAAAHLEKNETNRNVAQAVVERYSRDMKASRWRFTGDSIKFGKSGRLLDGQHRLWACVLAGIGFWTNVVRGLPDEVAVMDVIDTGRGRTLGDAFHIHGEKDSKLLASITSMCWRVESGVGFHGPTPTHEEGLAWLERNLQAREAVLIARAVYRATKVNVTAVGSSFYLNSRVDPEAAQAFWEAVATGENLTGGSPVLAYRRWAVGAISSRDKPRPEIWLAFNLKAMNQWRAGKKVRLLHWKTEEGLPEVWK